jgi:hypothetical protein
MPLLTITFATVTPAPPSGYRVRYWPTGSPLDVTELNTTTSPVAISVLGYSYEGTVEASCGDGSYSAAQSFTVTLSTTDPCYAYYNNTSVTWTGNYTDCNGYAVYSESIESYGYRCMIQGSATTMELI